MVSFAAFKLLVNNAFEGEPANITVFRNPDVWWVQAISLDEKTSVTVGTNENQMKTPSDCRAFALRVYQELIMRYDDDETREQLTAS